MEENLIKYLTPRQKEVLELLSKGISYKDIAKQLFISETTIKTHINDIFQTLGVHSRTEAVLYVINQKYRQPVIFLKEIPSEQEKFILQQLSLGFTPRQVSDKTKLSQYEVVTLLSDFFKKLDL